MSPALQVVLVFGLLVVAAVPLGAHVANVLQGGRSVLDRVFGPVERRLYALAGVDASQEQTWPSYAKAVLAFGALGALAGSLALRVDLPPGLALNTSVSFVTNTNWQGYAGERLSLGTQALVLGVQNFLSAATGIAVLAALARGFSRAGATTIGNFWVDLTRVSLRVLLPLSLVFAGVLVAQGVPQTFQARQPVQTLEGGSQTLALGLVASQVAIKQLGSNGGGYFNANGAHPFENPTPLTNLLETEALVLLAAAGCFAFGRLLGDRRQGWALFTTMVVLVLPPLVLTLWAEQSVPPWLSALGVDASAGNLEGKEVRFGATGSALWAVLTTAASNGSVNAMHDSLMPLGALGPLWLMQLGEVAFGGVGSGLYGLLMFALVAVFLAGLMVGRTPEYLGKKIEAREMKLACLVVLVPSITTLLGTALAASHPSGRSWSSDRGPHAFTELLYAFTSAGNNNGSAFAGLDASGDFLCVSLAICMWLGRYGVVVPVLACAGALAAKRSVPPSPGTLPTHGATFIALLVATVVLVGALTFVPALALGPIAEHLELWSAP